MTKSAHTTVRSKSHAHCPECKQQKLEFVMLLEGGSRCLDCHVSITQGTRPRHVAQADWAGISLGIRMFDKPMPKSKVHGHDRVDKKGRYEVS